MDGDMVLVIVDQVIVDCFAQSDPREEPIKPKPKMPPLQPPSSRLEGKGMKAAAHQVRPASVLPATSLDVAQHSEPDQLAGQLSRAYLDLKYLSMDVLGKASFNNLAISQWYGPAHERACKLNDIYSTGLDAGKTGVKVRPISFYHFLPHRILSLSSPHPRLVLEQVVMKELRELCIKDWPVFMEGRSADPTISYVEVPDPRKLPCGVLSCVPFELQR